MSIRIGMLMSLGLLLGCATGKAGIVSMEVSAQPAGKEEWSSMARGQSLKAGDRYNLRIDTNTPVYVYVARVPKEGTPQILFPDRGDTKVSPGAPLHVPTVPPFFVLPDEAGDEELRVVASAGPLTRDEVLTDAAAERTRDPPPILTDTNRGDVVRAKLIPRGAGRGAEAVLRFSIRRE